MNASQDRRITRFMFYTVHLSFIGTVNHKSISCKIYHDVESENMSGPGKSCFILLRTPQQHAPMSLIEPEPATS